MNEDRTNLTETFAAHEHLAPDAEAVLTRASEIARSYNRRRWAVRATGGAVLSAGIVAGSIALPGSFGHSSPARGSSRTVLSPAGAPTASPTPTSAPTYTTAQEMNAFFAAGYDYTDAQALAKLWNDTGSTNSIKAEAGQKLLEGQTLPVKPTATPESPANKDVNAFFAAGYSYDDAVTLSKTWHDSSYQAKAEGGKKLLAGETLPIPPSGPKDPSAGTADVVTGSSGATGAMTEAQARAIKEKLALGKGDVTTVAPNSSSDDGETPAQAAYFGAGYDYNDAVSLGKLWNQSDISAIKTEAGQKLLDGETLPIKPSSGPVEVISAKTTAEVNAFFNAGYTYNDAVKLGKLWNEDSWHAKADGGQKLMDGQTLPIAP
jgi:hypothetical protein